MAKTLTDAELKQKLVDYKLNKPGTYTEKAVRESLSTQEALAPFAIEDPKERAAAIAALGSGGGKLRDLQIWVDKETGAQVIAEPDGNGNYIVTHDEPGGPGKSGGAQTVPASPNQPWIGIEDSNAPDGIRWVENKNFTKTPGEQYGDKPVWDPAAKTWTQSVSDSSGKIIRSEPLPAGTFPPPKDDKEKPTVQFQTGGDGKLYPVTIGANGVPEVGKPLDIPPATVDKYSNVRETERGLEGINKVTGVAEVIPGSVPKTKPLVDLGDGRRGEDAVDANGNRIIKEVPVVGGPSGVPSNLSKFPSNTVLGGFSSILAERANELQEATERKEITAAQAEKSMEQYVRVVQTMVQEQTGVVSAQQTAFTGDVNQRGQTINDQISRRSFSSNAMDRALKLSADNAKYMPESARGQEGDPVIGQLKLELALADRLGALKPVADVKKGAALQQLLGIGLGGQTAQPAAATQPKSPSESVGGGMAPTFNINVNGQPGGNFMAPAMNPDWAIPAKSGMKVGDDGMLRAPGYIAPPPPPIEDPERNAFLGAMTGYA